MKQTPLEKLLEERRDLRNSLRNDPTGMNLHGKRLRKEPTLYFLELNRKINSFRKGN